MAGGGGTDEGGAGEAEACAGEAGARKAGGSVHVMATGGCRGEEGGAFEWWSDQTDAEPEAVGGVREVAGGGGADEGGAGCDGRCASTHAEP